MSAVDRKQVEEALAKRKSFILDNLESMTLKILRKHLEEDLGLEADALKPFKKMIGEYVDSLMAPPPAEEPVADEEEEAASDSGSDSDEDDKKSSKKRKTAAPAAPKAAPRTYTKKVERMRNLCRQATITVPPNIYVKNKTDKELEAAFEALLNKNGLGADAGANEVAKVKAQLQIQRDLDGIDTSNIISDGRRSRRGGATTDYKQMLKVSSDSEEEEEEQENSDASDSGSESEKEESPKKKEKKEEKKKTSPISAVEKSPEQPKKVAAPQPRPPSVGKQNASSSGGKALVDIGNKQSKTLADWSDDE